MLLLIALLFLGQSACDMDSLGVKLWERPRAALIRHDIYLDGGYAVLGNWNGKSWALDDGETGPSANASVYRLSLNESFELDGDAKPARFMAIPENVKQTAWLDGAMFGDYDEFYVWGYTISLSPETALLMITVECTLLEAPTLAAKSPCLYTMRQQAGSKI